MARVTPVHTVLPVRVNSIIAAPMTTEQRYENFLKKNFIISSTMDQISSSEIDIKGRLKFTLMTIMQVSGFLLQVPHLIAVGLPSESAKIVRNYTGDYLATVGYPGIAFTVILLLITLNCCLDRRCLWRAERYGFPALTHILRFRIKLSPSSAKLFEKRLNICSRLEKIADVAFVHPPILMHTGIVVYCAWTEKDVLFTVLKVISLATILSCIRDFIMCIIGSQTMLQLCTKLICLQIHEIKDSISKIREIREEGGDRSNITVTSILDDFEHVKRTLHVLQTDTGWIISNSMLVFLPVIGFILMGAIGSKDLMLRLFFSCVSSNFCLLFLMSISTAAHVHTGFKSLHDALAPLQLKPGMTLREKLRLIRTLKVISSRDRALSFYVLEIFPFDSTILAKAMTQILSMIFLLLPQFEQMQTEASV